MTMKNQALKNKPVRFQLYIPDEVYQIARKRAFDRHISLSKYIVRALTERINKETSFDDQECNLSQNEDSCVE